MMALWPNFALRKAGPSDLDWIVGQESRPDFAGFIHHWPRPQHARNLADPDLCYLIARDDRAGPLGFVILAGLASPARNIELVRMAVATPGQGLGRRLFRRVIRLAFAELGADRLWLDVYDDNPRARHVYRSAGFVEQADSRDGARGADGTTRTLVVMAMARRDYVAAAGTALDDSRRSPS